MRELHRDQIQVVLERQQLIAVGETEPGSFELLGAPESAEAASWRTLEEHGLITDEELMEVFPDEQARSVLDRLVERRVAFRSPVSGRYHALSRLVQHLL